MVGFLRSDEGPECSQRVVYPGVGHQVRLELGQVAVQSPVKPEAGGDGGQDLSYQPVEVGVGRPRHLQLVTTQIVDGLIIDQEGTVAVLQGGVGVEDGVVRLHYGSRYLRRRVDREF